MIVRALLFIIAVSALNVCCPAPAAAQNGAGNKASSNKNEEFQVKYFDLTEGRVAFSYIDGAKRDIYVLDFKDLNVTPVVTSPGSDEAPAWSPDGRRLVFHSDMTGNNEIYSINYDGTDLMQLTNNKRSNENPSYSPDGKKIIFQSSAEKSESEIYIMNVDGSQPEAIIPDNEEGKQMNVTPRYSPRGTEMLYVTNAQWPGWDIMLYDFESKQSKFLTQGLGSYIRPAWKPDGSSFAFSYGSGDDLDIWYAEKGKPTPTPLIRRNGRDLDPCWSDNGKLIFFAGEMVAGQGDYQLFIYNSSPVKSAKNKSGEQIQQVMNSRGSIRHPSFTPFPTLASLMKKAGAPKGGTRQ
jgi:Tol biopolymer transport system component